MKIAVVAVEANIKGGTERYAYELTKRLGADLYAAASNLKFRRVPSLKGPALIYKNLFPLFAQLIVNKNRYDIIHSHGASYLTPNISTAFTSQPTMLRLLRANELFISISCVRKVYWYARLFVPYLMEKRIYNRVRAIIATSNLLKRELIKTYKLPANRIYVVYPGVDLSEFKRDLEMRSRARKSLNLSGVVCIFVGSQWGRKGLQFLLSAVKGTEITLLVVGGGIGELEEMKKQILKSKKEPQEPRGATSNCLFSNENVRFLGNRSNLCELYNAADIFVLPTLFDGFALPVLEALACGLPVITSRFTGASEIIEGCGLIIDNPRDHNEIRDKIIALANDEKLRQEFSRNALTISRSYSWEKMVKRIELIYSSFFSFAISLLCLLTTV